MCCGFAVLALLGPRALAMFWWLFRPLQFNLAFDSIIWPILGILFMPWLTIAYVLVAPGGVNGWEWLWIGLGIFADIASYSGSIYGNKDELGKYMS